MSLPHVWARLPGPADFLDTILEDLTDRIAVLAGIPDHVPSGDLAVEMADMIKNRGLGVWNVVRSEEAYSTTPSDSIARRFDDHNASGSVLWIDATLGDAATAAWANHAVQLADYPDMSRLCIVTSMACAELHGEEKRLRRRLWGDFVTHLDSRALVERVSRRAGHKPPHIALKSTLISEIAGADLVLAERLSLEPIGRILRDGQHPRERIWAAQVSVLLPVVERERQRILDTHQAFWQLPHFRKDGTEILQLSDLEVGDMAAQARLGGPLESIRKRLNWLRSVRNALAHNEVVPWSSLTSPIAHRIMDFR